MLHMFFIKKVHNVSKCYKPQIFTLGDCIYELCLTLKEDSTDNKRTGEWKTKCQYFSKIKRAASQSLKQTQCGTFAFAQRTDRKTTKF